CRQFATPRPRNSERSIHMPCYHDRRTRRRQCEGDQSLQAHRRMDRRFMTDRRTRKVGEIARTGRMTLVYQHQVGGAYVTLVGRARIIDDIAVKQAIWRPGSFKWHPGGPTDANVVLIEFVTERIETWNTPGQIVPDPTKGLWAAVLTRDADGRRC